MRFGMRMLKSIIGRNMRILSRLQIYASTKVTLLYIQQSQSMIKSCSQNIIVQYMRKKSKWGRRRQYCELTALYWIWKNTKEDVVGLSHYRRHFILPDNWQDIMYTNDIDVILPVPTFVYPNIRENYKERHDPSDWEYMMYYLEQNYPNDFNEAEKVFSKNLYFPCNMFIVRRKILDDLCSWMFPIIDAVVKHGGVKEDTYLNRYQGFISERLITLYFLRKSINYHIVYADKNFIV